MSVRILLLVGLVVGGCAHEPSPAEIALARNANACRAACDLKHEACVLNPPGLCIFPCGRQLFECRMRCPPGPPPPPISVYPRAFEGQRT